MSRHEKIAPRSHHGKFLIFEEFYEKGYLVVDNFNLENVQVNYNSVPDGINANIDINEFLAEVPLMDLKTKEIEVAEIALQNSDIKLEIQTLEKPQDSTVAKTSPFTWPDWKVSVNKIEIKR